MEIQESFGKFNADYGGKWKIATNQKTGAVEMLTGFKTAPMSGNFRAAAQNFLSSYQKMLGVDAQNLTYKISSARPKFSHVSYQQTYQGIPVEGGDVSVHLTPQNEVLAVFSNYKPDINVSTSPALSAFTAETTVKNDLRLTDVSNKSFQTQLEVFTDEKTNTHYLAYKVELTGTNPIMNWIYFIDAQNGSILLKYDNLRYATSGTVQGQVYGVDGSGALQNLPISNQYVNVGNIQVTTGSTGNYSTSATGTVSALLQGPYVTVYNEDFAVGRYSDGTGTWVDVPYSLSTAHNYSNCLTNDSACESTIGTITHPGAAYLRVHFSVFSTYFESFLYSSCGNAASGYVTCGDFVNLYDKNNNLVRYYIGSFGSLTSDPVLGDTITIKLKPNAAYNDYGFDIDKYSYFSLSSSQSPAPSWTWDNTTADVDEINTFYHINKIHDYYKNTFNFLGMDYPITATVRHGVVLLNAFYNPRDNNIYFGEGNSYNSNHDLALAADVLYHEYTHGAVDHIYALPGVGESGAMGEAFADYFAATITNDSIIGEWALGSAGQRNLVNTNNYPLVGEEHTDGLIYGGSLWDTRLSLGQSSADNIIFESLYFYPKSFVQGLQAMLLADDTDGNLSNGTPNKTAIEAAFSKHGITSSLTDDTYEPNDLPLYAYGPLVSGANYQSYISYASDYDLNGNIDGDYDMYKVNVNPGDLTVDLNSLPKDYNLYLFRVTTNLLAAQLCSEANFSLFSIASSANTGTANETLSYNVTDPETLYICVRPATTTDYSTTQTYTLKATFTTYTDTTPFSGTPSTPTDDGSSVCSDKVKFYWGAGTVDESKIASYYLDVGTTQGGTDVFSTDVGKVVSKEITATESGKTYYAKVKAKNDYGIYSAYSSDSDGIIALFSVAPTGVAATVGNGQANVSWTLVSGASSYNVYMASQSGVTKTNYATLTEGMSHTGITSSPYTHTGLTNGTTYYFVATAVNSCGESSESAEVSAKPVLETTAPVISSMLASDAGDTATITWSTDEPSDSVVDYGTTTGYGSTATSASLVSFHSVTLTGLSGNTSYNYRVKSADTWGNTATSPNAAFTTKTKLKYTFPKGVTMISLPLAVSSSAASLFGSALEKFGRWNPQGNVYDVSSSFNFSAGNGYWIKLASDKYFEVTGTPAPATQNFEVAIYPGWNQVGNPFLQSYLWENVSVKNKQSGVTKKLTDAAAAQWVGSYAWSYPGQAFGYQLTHPDKEGASRYLAPLYGYWVYSAISGVLVFDYKNIGATTAQKSEAASSDNILSVQLKAATDTAADDGSFFGITKVKTEDAIQKPPDPMENRLKTYFAGGGKQTASDFHFNTSQKEQVWDFIVECEGTKNVTLSWDIKILPPGAKLFLQDMESGAPLTMTGQNSMTVSVNEKKTFKIKYYKPSALSESGENGALFASKPYMFPNPDRTGNATFRYVTGPNVMRVGIEVYNLAGKLVDKFDGDLNGETHWLFGDRVAAGVYYYRITAYAADGKESVVGKMVVVR